MAEQNDNGFITMIAYGATTAFRACRLYSATQVALTTATTDAVWGICQQTVASGEPVLVKLLTAPGTQKVTLATTMSAASFAYLQATEAKFSTATSNKAAHTLQLMAAGVDGDVVEAVATFGQS